jgi:hypothetical protein
MVLLTLVVPPWRQAPAAEPASKPAAGALITVKFPEMPRTFAGASSQMTIYLPANYDANRRHGLLVFLQGGTGGDGGNPGVARGLADDKDFVCVSVPLFKNKDPNQMALIRPADGELAWPLYKKMLAKLEEAVPNLDANRRIVGGFSNGAHMTAALVDAAGGEAAAYFSAFFFAEGGGKLEHYERLKGKPFLMVYGSRQSQGRATEVLQTAVAAGAKGTLYGMHNVGHAFPPSEYPAVREWLLWAASVPGARGEAGMKDAAAKVGGYVGEPPASGAAAAAGATASRPVARPSGPAGGGLPSSLPTR